MTRSTRIGGESSVAEPVRSAVQLVAVMSAALVTGCGSSGSTGGQPTAMATVTATATATAPPCTAASPGSRPPIGEAQALSVIPVHVLAGVPASSGVMDEGTASCVNVGVSQRVSVHIHARIPPWPAETRAAPPLLSAITVSPAVGPSASVPQAGDYMMMFTARLVGSTTITYLAATCTLPPGVC